MSRTSRNLTSPYVARRIVTSESRIVAYFSIWLPKRTGVFVWRFVIHDCVVLDTYCSGVFVWRFVVHDCVVLDTYCSGVFVWRFVIHDCVDLDTYCSVGFVIGFVTT